MQRLQPRLCSQDECAGGFLGCDLHFAASCGPVEADGCRRIQLAACGTSQRCELGVCVNVPAPSTNPPATNPTPPVDVGGGP